MQLGRSINYLRKLGYTRDNALSLARADHENTLKYRFETNIDKGALFEYNPPAGFVSSRRQRNGNTFSDTLLGGSYPVERSFAKIGSKLALAGRVSITLPDGTLTMNYGNNGRLEGTSMLTNGSTIISEEYRGGKLISRTSDGVTTAFTHYLALPIAPPV